MMSHVRGGMRYNDVTCWGGIMMSRVVRYNDVTCCQVVEELKTLMDHYEAETGERQNMVGLALTSRKNLCIHPTVSRPLVHPRVSSHE